MFIGGLAQDDRQLVGQRQVRCGGKDILRQGQHQLVDRQHHRGQPAPDGNPERDQLLDDLLRLGLADSGQPAIGLVRGDEVLHVFHFAQQQIDPGQ